MNIIASNRPFIGKVASDPKELKDYLSSCKTKPTTIFFPFWSWKIPDNIINKYHCIGFHSAPLPQGKGGSPIQNMIRLGYKNTQLCMFVMTSKFDNGEVLARVQIALDGPLHSIIHDVTVAITNLIDDYLNESDYSKVPDTFKRISANQLPECETLKCIHNEIRMRDEEDQPKAFKYHGKYLMEFYNSELRDNEIIANVRISKK